MEVSSGHFFWEFASLSNEIEQLSSANEFEDDSEAIVSWFIFVFVGGVLSNTDQFDQVLMIKLLHDSELVFQSF